MFVDYNTFPAVKKVTQICEYQWNKILKIYMSFRVFYSNTNLQQEETTTIIDSIKNKKNKEKIFYKKYEKQSCEYSDLVLILSEHDKKLLTVCIM